MRHLYFIHSQKIRAILVEDSSVTDWRMFELHTLRLCIYSRKKTEFESEKVFPKLDGVSGITSIFFTTQKMTYFINFCIITRSMLKFFCFFCYIVLLILLCLHNLQFFFYQNHMWTCAVCVNIMQNLIFVSTISWEWLVFYNRTLSGKNETQNFVFWP